MAMNAEVISSPSWLRNAVCVLAMLAGLGGFARAQTATIDFDYPDPVPPRYYPPDWNLPWSEDGYTVASERGGGAGIQGDIPVTSAPPPYPGFLQLHGTTSRVGYIFITNDASLLFDLLSVDVLTVGLGTGASTNYASIISSAGGSLSLLGTPNGTTIHFGEDGNWRGVSFIRIECLTDTFPSDGLQLDNFVLQPAAVPEPSLLGFLVLAGSVVLSTRIRRLREAAT